MTAHLRYIPFESLSLHYSPTPTPEINISLDALFKKIITPRNRGGYCIENNTLFYALLQILGFTVGLISPFPLVAEKITQGIGPEQYRLHFAPLKQMQNQALKYWILQWRESDGKEWEDLYAFSTEVEFSREDYEVMNLAASTMSVFVGLVCCFRNMLGDKITDSEAEVVQVYKSECERAEALETWFGMVLTEKEREGIRKRPTEIKKEGESYCCIRGRTGVAVQFDE
ncbi:hypothetical protein BDD12DRAFT_876894 [Trichophaea hybrida]|nr:hypothetical protein BDD12DRAFT_876894 [Trichophaea hybrida]